MFQCIIQQRTGWTHPEIRDVFSGKPERDAFAPKIEDTCTYSYAHTTAPVVAFIYTTSSCLRPVDHGGAYTKQYTMLSLSISVNSKINHTENTHANGHINQVLAY